MRHFLMDAIERSGKENDRARAQPLASVLVLVIEQRPQGPNPSSIWIDWTLIVWWSNARPIRVAVRLDGVAESQAGYRTDVDYEHEHEHRFAEHEK